MQELTNENMSGLQSVCPNCAGHSLELFYEAENIPVNSVLVIKSKEEAIGYPKGDLRLAFCNDCGFIFNTAFDSSNMEYSQRCEETQAFSPTFSVFHRNLAQKLIGKYDLFNKTVLEIGCGKGEFLTMLCEMGNNKGIGFDPAYISERNQSDIKGDIVFIEDFYSQKYSDIRADLIICKMTLEHIPDTLNFLSIIRESIGPDDRTALFFQVPDVTRILKDLAFWDIYYEHCSYFSPVSLFNLFKRAGFNVTDLYNAYDDQYLIIEAVPGTQMAPSFSFDAGEALADLRENAGYFRKHIEIYFSNWTRNLKKLADEGKKIVIWGGGSKAVSFLTTLGIQKPIEYIIDINPHKNDSYILGTGQHIMNPGFLAEYRPDTVIVMNPVYIEEIRSELQRLGLEPELIPVDTAD